MVGLRAEDLGQPHDLPARVRDLQTHARLAGNGLDHADRHHRERPCEILHQVDDLAALDPDRGLDLVARDHRPRIGGEHLDLDAEIFQLLLDQPRGELQRLGTHQLDAGRLLVEQRERRERRVGQVLEERHLLFLDHPLGLRNLRDLRLDPNRRVVLDPFLFGLDDDLALHRRDLADLAVSATLPEVDRLEPGPLRRAAEAFHHRDPRHPAEEREPDRRHRQEEQCRAGEAERPVEHLSDHRAEEPAGRERQARLDGVETKRLDPARGDQQHREAGERDDERPPVGDRRAVEPAVAPDDGVSEQHHPPPRGNAEEVEHQIREPRARAAAGIVDAIDGGVMRPTRIGAVERRENERKICGDGDEGEPFRLAQPRRDLARKGLAGGGRFHLGAAETSSPGGAGRRDDGETSGAGREAPSPAPLARERRGVSGTTRGPPPSAWPRAGRSSRP